MELAELQAAQRELFRIAAAAQAALANTTLFPEGSTMRKAATAALDAVQSEAEGIAPFIDALVLDADRVITGHVERDRARADAPNALRRQVNRGAPGA